MISLTYHSSCVMFLCNNQQPLYYAVDNCARKYQYNQVFESIINTFLTFFQVFTSSEYKAIKYIVVMFSKGKAFCKPSDMNLCVKWFLSYTDLISFHDCRLCEFYGILSIIHLNTPLQKIILDEERIPNHLWPWPSFHLPLILTTPSKIVLDLGCNVIQLWPCLFMSLWPLSSGQRPRKICPPVFEI